MAILSSLNIAFLIKMYLIHKKNSKERFQFLAVLFSLIYAFPKLHAGYLHSAQPRHKPPCPRLVMSLLVTGIFAATLGSIRSKIVDFAYMTQPGNPKIGVPSSKYARQNIAPGNTGAP